MHSAGAELGVLQEGILLYSNSRRVGFLALATHLSVDEAGYEMVPRGCVPKICFLERWFSNRVTNPSGPGPVPLRQEQCMISLDILFP